VRARYYDGLTARPHEVDVALADGRLTFDVEGAAQAWRLDEAVVERAGDFVRISRPGDPARLHVAASDWPAPESPPDAQPILKRNEVRLVAGLALAGLAMAAFVFVGMPMAAGPLARHTPVAFERRIGDSFEAQLGLVFKDCEGEAGQDALYAFGDRLETGTSPFNVRVRAVQAPFANAFALPGGAVLVTDDLIAMAETPDELAAVIAHEAAHVELRHVMQAVWRSLGLGLVLDLVVGGGTGAGQQAVLLLGNVADLGYSREAEAEADARGRDLLHAQGLSSEGMAPFFERLAAKNEGRDAAAVKEFVSSHPASLRRAEASRAAARPGEIAFEPTDWAAIKAACEPRG
jgi:beta-barrel assembly-enhancing protease